MNHRTNNALAVIAISAFLMQILGSCSLMRKSRTVQTYEQIKYNSDSVQYMPITWSSDSVDGIWREKHAFHIPVHFGGIEKGLYMQFDLGAPSSVLYENSLNAIIVKNPELEKKLTIEKKKMYFNKAQITLNNNIRLQTKKIPVYRDLGQEKMDSTFNIIGSIGFDILGDNVLILDFKNDRYALTATIPPMLETKAIFVADADLNYFPVILPFKFGKKKIRLMFDTGASMFPIITGIKQLKKVANGNKIDSLCCLHAWGKYFPYYRTELAGNLKLDNINFGNIDMYGIESMNKLSFIKNYIFGVTGNTIFENSIIIIDRKNSKFGVIK